MARALWILLVALALARATLAFVPTMWAWGLNLMRFVALVPGWTLWAAGAALLVPALARRTGPWAARATGGREAPWWRAYAPWAAGAAAVAWLLPDRVLFVGDYLLRETSIRAHTSGFRSLYPQALPLDLFLHDTLVRALAPLLGLGVDGIARLLGGIEAGLLGVLAVRLARVLGLDGAGAMAASAALLSGGYFALFTGYNKAFSEMTLVTATVGIFGADAARRGRGLLPMGLALALGLLLHRIALALLPAAAVAWALWFRRHGRSGAWRSREALISLGLPVAALAVMGPHLARLVARFDLANFLPEAVRRQGGVPVLSGPHLADLANLIVLMSPLAPALALVPWLIRRAERGREAMVFAALAIPLLAFMPFFRPPLGLFRNWEAYAPTGVALSLAAAWTAAEILRAGSRSAGLGVAMAVAAAVPGAQWLVHQSDSAAGLRRAEAFLHEPPARPESARASAWEYLGLRYLDLGRVDASAFAFASAAELTPSPKILREWAMSEVMRGDREIARRIYRALLARKPDDLSAWLELAMLSVQLGDRDQARAAAEQALKLRPGQPQAQQLLQFLDQGAPPAER